MMKTNPDTTPALYIGLDVHKEKTSVAIADPGANGEIRRHGMLDLGYLRGSWESHIERFWASAQNRVSDLQNEQPTPGYCPVNLRLAKTFADSVRVEVGAENLLDKHYADHLGGVNRVAGGDLAIGEAIPGTGRITHLSVGLEFRTEPTPDGEENSAHPLRAASPVRLPLSFPVPFRSACHYRHAIAAVPFRRPQGIRAEIRACKVIAYLKYVMHAARETGCV